MDLPAVGAKLGRISTCVTATVHAHAVYDREKEVADTWEGFRRQAAQSF